MITPEKGLVYENRYALPRERRLDRQQGWSGRVYYDFKKHGFQGMVITDHDTYNGYRYWKENIKGKKHTDFVVLKGIEYDTRDAGHILVIMPEGVKMRLLEMRGCRWRF